MKILLFGLCMVLVVGVHAGGGYDHGNDDGYGDDEGELITPGVPMPDPVTDAAPAPGQTTKKPEKVIEGNQDTDYYDPNEPCPGCKGKKKRKVQLKFRIKLKQRHRNKNVNKIRIAGLDNCEQPVVVGGPTTAAATTAAATTAAATTAPTTAGTTTQKPIADNGGLNAPAFALGSSLQSNVDNQNRLVNVGGFVPPVVPPQKPEIPKPILPILPPSQTQKLKGNSQLGVARASNARAEKPAGGKMMKKLVDLRQRGATA